MLRLIKRDPDRFPMERLAEYLSEFAELLGPENRPVFKGIKRRSVGIAARVPAERSNNTHARLVQAKSDANSRVGKTLQKIEALLGQDHIMDAELLDESNNVIYLFRAALEEPEVVAKVYQQGDVDGVVTGLVGADDTMHLHLRDHLDRDLRLIIRDESLARDILRHFREGFIRLSIQGTWVRTDQGWIPETSKCTVLGFTKLEELPIQKIFSELANVPGNGWAEIDQPLAEWASIRGIQ